MSGWQVLSIVLAGVICYGFGYGSGSADAKNNAIQSFRDFGVWTHNRTKIVSSEVTTITPTPPPVEPRPVPPETKPEPPDWRHP